MLDISWDVSAELTIIHAVSSPFALEGPTGDVYTHEHALYNFELMVIGFSSYMEANPADRWFCQSLHRPLCDWMQEHILRNYAVGRRGEQERTKLMVLMPRFSGKTESCTKGSTLWQTLLDRNAAMAVGSETSAKAESFSDSIKQAVSGGSPHSRWVDLYGNFKPIGTAAQRERAWTKLSSVHTWRNNLTDTNPWLNVWAANIGLTGFHPTGGWLDDPLSEDKMRENGTWRETVVKGVRGLRPAFRTHSVQGVALTRKHHDDVAGKLLVDEGILTWSGHPIPIITFEEAISPHGEWHVYYIDCYDPITQESVLPLWSTKALHDYERAQPAEFACEMRNCPSIGERTPITAAQIEEMYIHTSDLPADLLFSVHLDTAFKSLKNMGRGDWSVIEVWGHCTKGSGTVYYIEGYGSKMWRNDEFTDTLMDLLVRYRKADKQIAILTDEGTDFGKTGVWAGHLKGAAHRRGIPLPKFHEFSRRNGSNNTARIITAAGFWTEGRVRLVRGAPGLPRLVEQMLQIGLSSNDDWASAAADVFADAVYKPLMLRLGRSTKPITQPGDDILRSGNVVSALGRSMAPFLSRPSTFEAEEIFG